MPGVNYAPKYCQFNLIQRNFHILEYFDILPIQYDNWLNWYINILGSDVNVSKYDDYVTHMEICNCWLKNDSFWLSLDQSLQLMVFMCLNIKCRC